MFMEVQTKHGLLDGPLTSYSRYAIHILFKTLEILYISYDES